MHRQAVESVDNFLLHPQNIVRIAQDTYILGYTQIYSLYPQIFNFQNSMMEETDVRHRHRHAVFIRRLDDIVVADGASCLRNVLHTALVGTLNVVAKGEEGVAAERHIRVLCNPVALLFAG